MTAPRRRAMLASTMRIIALEPILVDVPLRESVHGVTIDPTALKRYRVDL